jgi:hypothetical protein
MDECIQYREFHDVNCGPVVSPRRNRLIFEPFSRKKKASWLVNAAVARRKLG